MIGRVARLFQAFSGQGDQDAVEIVEGLRLSGVSIDALADALDDILVDNPEQRSFFGSHPAALAASSVVAAIAGSSGLFRLNAAMEFTSPLWVVPLLPVPVLVGLGVVAVRRRHDSHLLGATGSRLAEQRLLARGIPLEHARVIGAFLAGGVAQLARARASRLRPTLIAGAATLVIVAFWSCYYALITCGVPGTDP